MNPLLHTALVWALTSPGANPLHTALQEASEPASQDYHPAHITIDTSALRSDLDPQEVDKQQDLFERDVPTFFLGETQLVETASDDSAEIRIIVRWDDFADFRYGVRIEATTPDGREHDTSFVFQGDEHDLLTRMKDEVPTVLGWLERPDEATPPPASSTPSPGNLSSPGETTPPPEPRLHALGKAGIGVAAVGLAAGIAGVVLFTRTDLDTTLNGDRRERTQERSHPTLSVALMAAGGAVLITGAALLATDLARPAKPKARAHLTPVLSSSGGGLSLSGRF